MPESATVAVPVGRGATDRRRVVSRMSTSGPAEKGWPLRLGVLTEQIAPALVDEVVAAAGATQRRARLLPARAVVYFVLALGLFSGADAAAPPGYRVGAAVVDQRAAAPLGCPPDPLQPGAEPSPAAAGGRAAAVAVRAAARSAGRAGHPRRVRLR